MLREVSQAKSWSDLIRNLGLNVTGGTHRHIQMIVKGYNINCDHFTGKGWSRGLTKDSDESVARVTKSITTPDEEVFKLNSTYPGSKLKKRLLAIGWTYKCECGLTEWLGKPITLHVDHINGVCNDHRLTNLRFLCPNCHQQTQTWGSKNKNA